MVHSTDDSVLLGSAGDLVGSTEESNRFNSGKDTVGVGDFPVITNDHSVANTVVNHIAGRSTEDDRDAAGCGDRVTPTFAAIDGFNRRQHTSAGNKTCQSVIPDNDVVG